MSVTPSRRHVLKAAAWSAPVVVVASAAPAYANSHCTTTAYTMDWRNSGWTFVPTSSSAQWASGEGTGTATALTTGLTAPQIAAIQPLTVTGTNTVPTSGTSNRMRGGSFPYGGNTFSNMRVSTVNVSGFGHRGLALAQDMAGRAERSELPLSNHYQELTLSFSRPVTDLSFRIGDIDATNGNHSDRVTVAPQAGTVARQNNVLGNGTGTADGNDPFRPSGTAIVNDTTGTAGNVTMTWGSTALSAVTIRFWNNVNGGGMQWIFLSNLTFRASTCA